MANPTSLPALNPLFASADQVIWNEEAPLLGPTVLGAVQDCRGAVPNQQGLLCGASSAFVLGHYVYVAAAMVNRITVIDVYRPLYPTLVGSVQNRVSLKKATSVFVTGEGDVPNIVVVAAKGESPLFDGHVTIIDVSPDRWYTDASGRWHVQPVILGSVSDCRRVVDNPTAEDRLLLFGTLCSARDVWVEGVVTEVESAFAFVAAEYVHSVTVVQIDFNDMSNPRVIGTVRDPRLEHIRSLAVVGDFLYAVSKYCDDCLTRVNVRNRFLPVITGTVLAAAFPQPDPLAPALSHMEFIARGDQDARYVYQVDPYVGKLDTLDRRCRDSSEALGSPQRWCAREDFLVQNLDGVEEEPFGLRHFRSNGEREPVM